MADYDAVGAYSPDEDEGEDERESHPVADEFPVE